MAKESVDVLIQGGKATAAPPLGPALGPLGVNIGEVVAEINKKTQDFKGMQVPVKVIVDKDTKKFEITIGTPPASALIKKEAELKSGSGNPKVEFVADLAIEQIIKIAKMKEDALLGKTLKEKCREIIGTCQSMGVKVEGKIAQDVLKAISNGEFDDAILSGKTELTAEEKKQLDEERNKMQKELEEKRAHFEAEATRIIGLMKNKKRADIAKKLSDAGIPIQIINEKLPKEDKK